MKGGNSNKMIEEKKNEKINSIKISRGMSGKYSFEIKNYYNPEEETPEEETSKTNEEEKEEEGKEEEEKTEEGKEGEEEAGKEGDEPEGKKKEWIGGHTMDGE